ncbi:hypothetical protein ICN30_08170 [Polynucleobacter sp. 31A-FELB]|uniref:beta strand repeat-containing protein n=1 Tax=Polynucleobacter sp. 31A-FELB TaxID=2689096 RepID=UPI001C0D379D|nr:hypothetical protein [Polynucleobacter sp. 31A-FELB]MBU3587807.1 hypothetical protein [Polynucleobacter sp. 31A-FELB]
MPTLNTFDTINGGNGSNTLQIEGSANVLTGTITNMQNLVYGGSITTLGAINTNLVGGLTKAALQNTTIATSANGTTGGQAITGLNNGATVQVTGTIAAADYVRIANTYDVGATTANLAFANASSSGTGNFIVVETAGTTTDTLNTLTVSGSTKYTSAASFTKAILADGTANDITTLNVNAAAGGTLALVVGDTFIGSTLTTINASGSTGNTIIDNTGTATDLTYTGGAGDDILYMDFTSINSSDVITAGTGTDSLRLDVAIGATSLNYTVAQVGSTTVYTATPTAQGYALINATGFEQVGFNLTGNGTDNDVVVLDMSKLTASSVRAEASLSVTKALDADTFVGAQDVTFTIAHDRSAIGPNYSFSGSGIANVSVESGKTVTIASVENDGAGAAASGNSDFAKLVLTGSGNVTFNNLTGAGTTVATAGGATVDASALSGSLVWTGNTVQTDYVTLGSGADTLSITGSTAALYDRVTGFGTTDKVTLITTYAASAWAGLVTVDSGISTVSAAITDAATQIAATSDEAGYFLFNGNTYVVDLNSTDPSLAIQLVGSLTLGFVDPSSGNSYVQIA